MKKIVIYLTLLLMPLNVLAYSDEVILGGHTLGIDVKTDGVLIVGFYKVNGSYNKGSVELKEGDYIYKINGIDINTIEELTNTIENNISNGKVTINFRRGDKEYTTVLTLVESSGIYKTGLYVKDSITGIGTLTYIDPTTMIYGALGHEIIESNTNSVVEIKTGTIFENQITSITKSNPGSPGSKNASFMYSNTFGTIRENTKYGIYGEYNLDVSNYELIKVASNDEVKIGPATIYTVINEDAIIEYAINITAINETSDIKNIVFEITDENLIDKTGGVVQGMSGSPIVQNNKIVGAVTHVIVDNPVTGYGLFITTMLEEGEN